MTIKPLDIRTVRNLPMLKRVLMAYEAGVRAEDIAERESTPGDQVSTKMIYHWLVKAREMRERGAIDTTIDPGGWERMDAVHP